MEFYGDITLLSEQNVLGTEYGKECCKKLEVLEKYGIRSAITDLAILTGGYYGNVPYLPGINKSQRRVGKDFTRSDDGTEGVFVVGFGGAAPYSRSCVIRPVLQPSFKLFSDITSQRTKIPDVEVEQVAFGEYPQYAPNAELQQILEEKYWNIKINEYQIKYSDMKPTGKNYTFNKKRKEIRMSTWYQLPFATEEIYSANLEFQPDTYDEYCFNDKKYVRINVNLPMDKENCQLSNGEVYKTGDYVWVEVSPVMWLIDDESRLLISKRGLLSGISFLENGKRYNGDFSTTEMKNYLNKYMINDLLQNATLIHEQDASHEPEEQLKRVKAKNK